MRLYRGLKSRYRPDPDLVGADRRSGTDFTDCPATALLYAQGSRGQLLVVDVDNDDTLPAKVTKELWLDRAAQRFMIWGRFDDLITAVLPAKDLRTRLRREGLRNSAHARKARALRALIEDELRRRALRSKLEAGSDFGDRVSSHEQEWASSRER